MGPAPSRGRHRRVGRGRLGGGGFGGRPQSARSHRDAAGDAAHPDRTQTQCGSMAGRRRGRRPSRGRRPRVRPGFGQRVRAPRRCETGSGVRCLHASGMQVVVGRARQPAALPVPLDLVLLGRDHRHTPVARRAATVAEVPGTRNQRGDRGFRADGTCVAAYGVGMTDTPWEPPLAGSELEHLAGALDRLRMTFRWKVDDLEAAGLATRIGASALTLGGLLKHMAINEDFITTQKLSGEPVGEPWESLWDGTDDWEFTSAVNDTPERLYTFWDEAVARSRGRLDAALARGGLDQLVHVSSPEGEQASLRRLLCDLIEEYGRHTGHADLLREAVDGRVGEDPPPGWRPVSGLR